MTSDATVPVRAKCLGCQETAIRASFEETASIELIRIRCATCGGQKRIAKVVFGPPAAPPPEIDLVAEARRIFEIPLDTPEAIDDASGLGDHVRQELFVEPPAAPPAALEAGLSASDASGRAGWSEEELAAVKQAILSCADRLDEFTADSVWDELPAGFPVTKGLAGRLNAAAKAGVIEATGRVAISRRQGEHGHGQRLGIWRSLRRAK